ncbi:DUF2147 domain-containing protein [Roseovarius amoyensis]|uniref:DUF2147 domain-containing protein n=1 Tax=Roseovarius amoyensis TaxID=2211448 RepID=UPI000DBEAA12|nr:DUF2147 domain-containing protein [Roseovarius amoyensis]
MKIMALAALAAFIGAGAALADPAEGAWRTQPGDTGGYLHVDIYGCGDALCGVIRKAISKDGTERTDYEHLNRRMLWDMQPQGGGAYGGGKIWTPDRDKTYNSKMQLSGNSLTVKGCVLGICRGQTWSRLR